MTSLDDIERFRPRLFGLAYRMLGSAADAEDVVQDAFLRYASAPREHVRSPQAFLTTCVTRLSLNHLKRARVKREVHVGPWLPEPIRTPEAQEVSETSDPADRDYDSISYAFLVLLERLSPSERAVFILREVFGYEYSDISQILEKPETACRQLFSRAKKHVAESKARFHTSIEEQRRLIASFLTAVQSGDIHELTDLLAERVVFTADGAGKVAGAALKPVIGAQAVAHFVLNVRERGPSNPQVTIVALNGKPGLLLCDESGKPFTALILDAAAGKIFSIWGIADPDKLQRLSEVHDPSNMLSRPGRA